MARKRKILGAITRDGMLAVARDFEIAGLTGKSRAEIVDALVATRSVSVEAILGTFGRDDFKTICHYWGWMTQGGRSMC